MIVVLTSFRLSKPLTPDEARRIFLSTAPTYRGVHSLLRKHYVLSEDGATAGGVYFWKSRAEAEAMYTPSWRSFVKEKYGTEPTVTYFDSPVVVDNERRGFLSTTKQPVRKQEPVRADA
jgi:hypothetical protein